MDSLALNPVNPRKPHLERIKPNLRHIKFSLLKCNMDYFLIITGYERVGKSNLAIAVAEEYLKTPPFKHNTHEEELTLGKENYIFSPEDFFRVPYELPRGSPMIVDEGGVAMLANEAVTAEGIEVKKIMTVMGERNLFVIICAPQLDLLQPYARARRIQSTLRVVRRGGFLGYNRPAILKIRKDSRTNQLVYPPPVFRDVWQQRTGALWAEYEDMKTDYLKTRNSTRQFVGATQAAKELEISIPQVYRLSRDGRLPGETHPITGRLRFNIEDLRLLKQQKR